MPEHIANPESEWHRRQLGKERQAQRRAGIAALAAGIVLLPVGAAFATWMYPQLAPKFSTWETIVFFITFLGGPLVFLLMGVMQYLDGRQPVSIDDIERRRQHERRELFRMAQGKLPWRYSKVSLGILTAIGLLFLIPGILALFDTPEYPSGTLVWGITYSLLGIFTLLYALVILPRRIKRLPAQSARVLGRSFVAGEITEGFQTPDEPSDG